MVKVQYVAHIQGHRWDLYGLSKIFTTPKCRVEAEQPPRRQELDRSIPEQALLFRQWDKPCTAKIYSSDLLESPSTYWKEIKIRAEKLVEGMNGIGVLLDPEFRPTLLTGLSYSCHHGGGQATFSGPGDWRERISLGRHPAHNALAESFSSDSLDDPVVRFVLQALNLPTAWYSLYAIYECIRDEVDEAKLVEFGWANKQKLNEFRKAANNSRDLRKGARHGKPPTFKGELMSLLEASGVIRALALHWVHQKLVVKPA